jgi:uncharacterized protein
MRWSPLGRSGNIEDRRGMSVGGAGLGIGGTLILLVLSFIFKQDFLSMFSGTDQSSAPVATDPQRNAAEEPMVQFVSFVLDDAQRTWHQILPSVGKDYHDAKLVLFRDAVQSGCGTAQSATGPFYCPSDERVYIDLSFFDELKRKFGAPGDFAQAYVIAHELGHHVQNILGIEQRSRQLARSGNHNAVSVRLELQADCFAGIWGHSTAQRNILESGDVEEGFAAAAAVGDDRLQRMGGRRVSPESFTHGSSEQRVGWFRRGLDSGKVSSCDTFASSAP